MSYILQALKDSEQQRSQLKPVSAPTNLEAPVTASPQHRWSRRRLGYILAFAIIAAAGWFVSNYPGSQAPAEVSATASDASQSAVFTAPAGAVVQDSEPDMRGVKLIINPPQSQPRATATEAPPAPRAVKQPANNAVSKVSPEPQVTERAADPYADLPYLRQLPVATQREIPELKFSVHIYSESRSGRMVKLNDRMMREGQRVAPNLNIEAIIPRGVVFNYRGERFKVPAR
ncbi:general secretion pathway protein GspB [Marinobacterium lutimaris]|uniref:General secretion pathway protein B n=1 Tax=Marinobacterium lutimaris TaxID=568106 RepID=A0A1H5WY83_9GAMM|nr:general secretion pathway protein GspB [Marinobacterium lutimaris]SEG04464.1 general secretion pathway protein B [Marinobacterium lutimaris]